jgi:tRNA G18 (ribose-2'-O)-methylase SpoU
LTSSARGAHRLVADAIRAAKAAGATGLIVVHAESAFYGHPVVAAARRAGARFSVTARMTPTVAAALRGEGIGFVARAPVSTAYSNSPRTVTRGPNLSPRC